MPERPLASAPWIMAFIAAAILTAPLIAAADRPGQDFTRIERGRYLTEVSDCTACHTNPDSARPFGGGRPIATPFGIVVAPNITPDRETGIGNWSAEQFDAAVRRGRRPDGKLLYPAMPFNYYTKMTRRDVDDIWLYLSTIDPVHNEVHANQLPFPYRIRAAMRVWDALYFQEGTLKSDASKSAAWNRGAYLVEGAGHCAACHTPKGWLGGDKSDQRLQGYALQGWFAPNITNDSARGLGSWSEKDLIEYLKSGHNRFSGAAGPMSEEIVHSSSRMTQEDLAAIATYLKSDERSHSQAQSQRAVAANDPQLRAGAAIYQDLCSACHRKDGTGSPYLIPDLAHSSTVASVDPASLLHVVIEGARSAATQDEPTSPAMPAFGWQLNDEQIAAVTTYLRNSWGHAAAAVSPGTVHQAREELQTRTD